MAVAFTQAGDASLNMEGTDGAPGAFIFVTIPYGPTSVTPLLGVTLPRRCIVKSITLVPDVVSTNAATVQLFRAPSGTALASGTLLHAGTANAQGAINVTQTLVLTGTAIDCPAGGRIGAIFSSVVGATGSGVITVALSPA